MCCDVGTHEAIIHDMSCQGKHRSDSAFKTLRPDQQRAALAALISWERSRLSHHVRRLQNRGLVECRPAPTDRRATEVTLTDQGWDEITRASSGHIDLVRRLFFEGLPDELLEPLTVGLESVYDNIIDRGTLPAPADES